MLGLDFKDSVALRFLPEPKILDLIEIQALAWVRSIYIYGLTKLLIWDFESIIGSSSGLIPILNMV